MKPILTQDADTNEWGVVTWLGTTSRATAKKKMTTLTKMWTTATRPTTTTRRVRTTATRTHDA